MATSTFKDVNREDYLRSLFTDLKKQAGIKELPEKSQVIYDYIMSNKTIGVKMSKNGIKMTPEGLYIIESRIHKK